MRDDGCQELSVAHLRPRAIRDAKHEGDAGSVDVGIQKPDAVSGGP